VGCAIVSRREVPDERKPVIRGDGDDKFQISVAIWNFSSAFSGTTVTATTSQVHVMTVMEVIIC